MYVLVTPSAVTLEEPANLHQFQVTVQGLVDDVGAALAGAGFGAMGEGDALISVAAVRAAAEGRVEAGWDGEFDKMLDYARTKGWLNADATAIQAHVEYG